MELFSNVEATNSNSIRENFLSIEEKVFTLVSAVAKK